MMHVEFMKIFFSPIRAISWLLDSFWNPEPKNKWFFICRHDVRRVHENFLHADSSDLMAVRLILAPEAENKWFLLCRHDVRRVNEKFSSPLIRASWWLLDSLLNPDPKTSESYFVDMIYDQFMKNFLPADPSELMAVRLTLASWTQKQVIVTL